MSPLWSRVHHPLGLPRPNRRIRQEERSRTRSVDPRAARTLRPPPLKRPPKRRDARVKLIRARAKTRLPQASDGAAKAPGGTTSSQKYEGQASSARQELERKETTDTGEAQRTHKANINETGNVLGETRLDEPLLASVCAFCI